MKPLFRTIALAAFAGLLSAAPIGIDAQHRTSRSGNSTSQSTPSRSNSNSGSSRNGGAAGNYRPGGSSSSSNRNNATAANRNNGSKQDRPAANPPSGSGNRHVDQPANVGNRNPGNRNPGSSYRPANAGNPGHPGHAVAPPPSRPAPPSARPYRPAYGGNHWNRPVPPPSWRPRPSAPVISTVLGITFGTAINLSVNALINAGYAVDGYANDMVFLRDVNSYGYLWPDATLYYGTGGMDRSEFLYSTLYPDPMRYYSLYNNFTGVYGAPVSYVNSGTALSATWFAPNRGYITLHYAPRQAVCGQMRYFTTLTLGL